MIVQFAPLRVVRRFLTGWDFRRIESDVDPGSAVQRNLDHAGMRLDHTLPADAIDLLDTRLACMQVDLRFGLPWVNPHLWERVPVGTPVVRVQDIAILAAPQHRSE